MSRKYTATQQRKALAVIDAQLADLQTVLDTFNAKFGDLSPVPDAIADAWNGIHDAVTRLQVERRDVDLNPRVHLSGQGAVFASLVAANID